MKWTLTGILALALIAPAVWAAKDKNDKSTEEDRAKTAKERVEKEPVKTPAVGRRLPARDIVPKNDPKIRSITPTGSRFSAAASEDKNKSKTIDTNKRVVRDADKAKEDDNKNKMKIEPKVDPRIRRVPGTDPNVTKGRDTDVGHKVVDKNVDKNVDKTNVRTVKSTNKFTRPETADTIRRTKGSDTPKFDTKVERATIGPRATDTRLDKIRGPRVSDTAVVKPRTTVKPDVKTVSPNISRAADSKVVGPRTTVDRNATRVRPAYSAPARTKTVTNTTIVNKKVVNYTEINKTVINKTYVTRTDVRRDRDWHPSYIDLHRHRDWRPTYVRDDFHPRSSWDVSFGFASGGYGGYGNSFAFGFHYGEGGYGRYGGFGRVYTGVAVGVGFYAAPAVIYAPPPVMIVEPVAPAVAVVAVDPYAIYPVWYRPAVVVVAPPPVAVVAVAPPPPPAPVVVAVDAFSSYPRWYRPSGIAISASVGINAEAPGAAVDDGSGAAVPADNTGATAPADPGTPAPADATADTSAPADTGASLGAPPAYDYGRTTLEGEIRFRNE